jgi:methionine biosynthesis protein MetW
MPVSKFMPHAWYDTPNIHFCTVKDFDALCAQKNIRILERRVVDLKHEGSVSMRLLPNLLGEIALYHIARG